MFRKSQVASIIYTKTADQVSRAVFSSTSAYSLALGMFLVH